MTNITELAQREKFEAWAEEAGALPWGILGKHRKQDGNYPGPHYTYMWKAWQAASAEMVEALEKAQQHIARQEQILLNQDESLSIRRGELEKAQAQSSKWLEAYHKAVSIGARYEERIAELESRTVTVKLPEPFKLAKSSSGLTYYYADEVNEALSAAGIKWEAE
ncbi:hypothetical protein PTQ57_30000 [Klebsiella pasteurii]|uniref:hypothetical protein n=1 Tax=Klebsiella pasteurii TaxID=2587529 RepID=UPI00287D28EC|nr:hypothetical protein [Klebsiella pasteurii]MDS7909643.1 hypothetical protein [Klebsiella pasteurii]MDV0997993.1 hypothetical protein [Klebsiella pasteurii]